MTRPTIPPAGHTDEEWEAHPVLNTEGALERLDGLIELVIEVVRAAIEAMPERRAELQEAYAAEDREALESIAHVFVGTLATVGAERSCALARVIEEEAVAGIFRVDRLAAFLKELDRSEAAMTEFIATHSQT